MSNRFMQPLRIAVQWAFLLFTVYLGMTFYRFVLFARGESGDCESSPHSISPNAWSP